MPNKKRMGNKKLDNTNINIFLLNEMSFLSSLKRKKIKFKSKRKKINNNVFIEVKNTPEKKEKRSDLNVRNEIDNIISKYKFNTNENNPTSNFEKIELREHNRDRTITPIFKTEIPEHRDKETEIEYLNKIAEHKIPIKPEQIILNDNINHNFFFKQKNKDEKKTILANKKIKLNKAKKSKDNHPNNGLTKVKKDLESTKKELEKKKKEIEEMERLAKLKEEELKRQKEERKKQEQLRKIEMKKKAKKEKEKKKLERKKQKKLLKEKKQIQREKKKEEQKRQKELLKQKKQKEIEAKKQEKERQKQLLKKEKQKKLEAKKMLNERKKEETKQLKKKKPIKKEETKVIETEQIKEEIKKPEPDLFDEEIKEAFTIIDNLLEQLPENVIDEFVQSDDFKIYEKVVSKYKAK